MVLIPSRPKPYAWNQSRAGPANLGSFWRLLIRFVFCGSIVGAHGGERTRVVRCCPGSHCGVMTTFVVLRKTVVAAAVRDSRKEVSFPTKVKSSAQFGSQKRCFAPTSGSGFQHVLGTNAVTAQHTVLAMCTTL